METEQSPLARISSDFLEYQYQVLGISEFMNSPDVTEICINRPGELYLETRIACKWSGRPGNIYRCT